MRWIVALCSCFLIASLVSAQPNPTISATAERLLSDFRNDDGTMPDGSMTTRDDSSALKKALNAGPGVVQIGPGTYRIQAVTIPENVTVIGTGPGTVLQAFGEQPVFLQQTSTAWKLRDLTIQGEASGAWQKRTDRAAHGMVIEACWGYEVSGVTIRNCDGAGLQIIRSNNRASGFTDGGTLTRITARENFIGIRFDTRAEYITASHLHCHHNLTGLIIHAGNTNIASSNIGDNMDGLVIVDHENGSHGSITGCLVNHNQRYALWARNVTHGMTIANCCFFYGTIRIENCSGVSITSGLISASISTEGPDFNRLSGNHIIPLTFQFDIAPSTLLDGNFTKTGPWEHNRR
jgi:hypothetical protein